MENKQLIKQKSKSYRTLKRTSLILGTVVAVFIAITPYIYYLYQGVPDRKVWDSPFGIITSNFYDSVQVMSYILMGKLMPIFLLLIWFFTCKHWWYHVIIIPILMFTFQAYTVINTDMKFSDSNEFFVLAPIIFLFLIFSYTVRMRVFDKIHGIDFGELARGNWKGEIAEESEDDNVTIINKDDQDEDDGDNEPLFMGY